MHNIDLKVRTVAIDSDTILYSNSALQQDYEYILTNKTSTEKFTFKRVADYKAWLKNQNESLDNFFVDKNVFKTGSLQFAAHGVKLKISQIVEAVGADDFRVVIGGSNNFRMNYPAKWTEYKAQRAEKPLLLAELKEWVKNHYGSRCICEDGYEADDVLSMIGWWAYNNKSQQSVILSVVDKDIRYNTVGYFYNYGDSKAKIEYNDGLGMFKGFCRQMLVGDTCDNIPNVKTSKLFREQYSVRYTGIGEATADVLFADCKTRKDFAEVVVNVYKNCYYDEYQERLQEQGFFLWLKRHPEDVFCLKSWLEKCGVNVEIPALH